MSEALTKYKEFTEENTLTPVGKSLGRVQLRNRLEKCYPNEFLFIVPNKHDGTFIALNDIDYYLRFAIKRAQQDRIKATEVLSFLFNQIFYCISRLQFYPLLSFLQHRKIINVKHVKRS